MSADDDGAAWLVEHAIRAISGVVATGLFLGMVHTVLVENDGQVEVRVRPGAPVR